jgi:signal transduction histidine kinase/CheY-like chemotaxis protein
LVLGGTAPLRLLVVDDEEVDRAAVRRCALQAGIRLAVDEAASAAEAVERIGSGAYDCVLLDYLLPGEDGLGLLQTIRAAAPDMPVVILTGHGDEQIAVDLMKAGAADYLPKVSLSPERLASSLRHALELARAARRTARLHAMSVALTVAAAPEEVAEVITAQACAALGAVAGAVLVVNAESDTLEVIHASGYSPAALAVFGHMAVSDSMPVADALRRLEPALYETREAVLAGYPNLRTALEADDHGALAVLPLRLEGEVLGGLRLSFGGPQTFDEQDKDFMVTLAQQGSQALERARLYAAERAARAEAEVAVEARDNLMAVISHDLRNPLTAVRGQLQLLRRRIARGASLGPEQLLAGLERAEADLMSLAVQIDELQDATHLQAGRPLQLDPRPTDLVVLVREAVRRHEGVSDELRLHLETAVLSLVGTWDAKRLGRVIDNLLSNAFKYSPAGGDVKISLTQDGDWAVLAIEDQGIGIPAEDFPHIFERFRRAGNVIGQIPGSGLGLAGARDIVSQHRGSIYAEHVEAGGTRFVVRLPGVTG